MGLFNCSLKFMLAQARAYRSDIERP